MSKIRGLGAKGTENIVRLVPLRKVMEDAKVLVLFSR